MDDDRVQSPSPVGLAVRNRSVLLLVTGWMILWMTVYGVAGYQYVKVAVERQPDLLKSVVNVTAPSEVDPSRDTFQLKFQAVTRLPAEGADVQVQADERGAWVTIPAQPARLSNDQPEQTMSISVRQRPTLEPAKVTLMVRPVTPETVLVLPSEPLVVTILPRPKPLVPPSIQLSAPKELAASRREFEVGITLHHGQPGETAVVAVHVKPADSGIVEPAQQEVRLSDVDSQATLRFTVPKAPSSAQTISLEAKSADGFLKDRVTLTILPENSPPPDPLLAVKIASPDKVAASVGEFQQTLFWSGLRTSAPRRLKITHNGPTWVKPAFQEMELREQTASVPLKWNVISHPLAAEQTIQFQVTADRVAPVAPWSVTLQPLIAPETRPAPLLVIIDTTQLRGDTAAWFAPLIGEVLQTYRQQLRGETAIVLRKEGPPEPWSETTTFGAAGAYSGATANDAMQQLANFLKGDDASKGPVIVLWANAFAPSGDAEIPYPLPRQRKLTLLWMNVENVEEQGLFEAWNKGDTEETFQIQLLAAPENYLKTSLDQLLSH